MVEGSELALGLLLPAAEGVDLFAVLNVCARSTDVWWFPEVRAISEAAHLIVKDTVRAAAQVLLVLLRVVTVAKHVVLSLVPREGVVAHVDVLVGHACVRCPSLLQVVATQSVLVVPWLAVALQNLVGHQVLWRLGAHLLLALGGLFKDALLLFMVLPS